MGLPVKALPTAEVEVAGEKVKVRGLSRAEALHLNTAFRPKNGSDIGDVDGAEVYMLVKGAGVTEDEATAWRNEVDVDTAGLVINKILMLSGLTDDGEPDSGNGSGELS